MSASRWTPQSARAAGPWGEEESLVTTCLLEYADLLGTKSPLTTWLAWALQRHQEASQEYYERKLSELTASLEQTTAAGHAGAQPRDAGGEAEWPSKVPAPETPAAEMPVPRRGHTDGPKGPHLVCCSNPTSASQWRAAMEAAMEDHDDKPKPSEVVASAPETYTLGNGWSMLSAGTASVKSLASRPTLSSCVATLSFDVGVGADYSSASPLPSPRPTEVHFNKALEVVNVLGVIVVSVNAAVIFMELEQQGARVAGQLGISPDWPLGSSWDSVFVVSDWIFTVFYMIELLAKNFIMRMQFWRDAMNVLDAFVAMASMMDLIFQDTSSNKIVLARTARCIKVTKLARLTRIVRYSNEMSSLIKTLYLSLKALLSSTVLLMLIVFTAGLAMTHSVGNFLANDCAPDILLCDWAYRHYGTASRGLWTMFQVTLSGGWPKYAEDLVEDVSGWYTVFWVVYIIVVWFGVIRVISALFLKETMEIAADDHEELIKEKMRKKAKYVVAMRKFFVSVDTDCDGFINHAEFSKALADPHAKAWLQTLEIDFSEIDALFQMLDDGDGQISFDELLASAVRLRGAARASEQVAILINQKTLLARLDVILDNLGSDRPRRV